MEEKVHAPQCGHTDERSSFPCEVTDCKRCLAVGFLFKCWSTCLSKDLGSTSTDMTASKWITNAIIKRIRNFSLHMYEQVILYYSSELDLTNAFLIQNTKSISKMNIGASCPTDKMIDNVYLMNPTNCIFQCPVEFNIIKPRLQSIIKRHCLQLSTSAFWKLPALHTVCIIAWLSWNAGCVAVGCAAHPDEK